MEQTFVPEFVPVQWFDELADPAAWFDSTLGTLGSALTQDSSDDAGVSDSVSFEISQVWLQDAGLSDSIAATLELYFQEGAGSGDSIQRDLDRTVADLVTTTDSYTSSQMMITEVVGTTDHATIEGPPSGFIGWGIPLH